MTKPSHQTSQQPPKYLKQIAYARYKGWDRSRITRLKEAGIVVFNEKGEVDVAATDQAIGENQHPALDAVREYHAQKRADKAETNQTGVNPNPPRENAAQQSVNGVDINSKAIHIRTANEFEKLKASKRENELAEGKLMQAEDVIMTVSDAAAVIRSRLEALPDNLSAQFAAENDEAKIRTALTDFVDSLLAEMHRKMQRMGKNEG